MRLIFTVGTAGISGGTAVLNDMIQFSKDKGYDTFIHCLDTNTHRQWLDRHPNIPQIANVDFKPEDVFVASEEFVWAVPHLTKYTSNYIVLNQGLFASLVSDFGRNTYPATKLIYQGALGVIGNSEHTNKNIIKLFNLDETKVHLFTIGFSNIFEPKQKDNTVSYMSRKNRAFGCFVVNYLSGKYPDVNFVDINNMSIDQVADVMGRSKLFLSFGGPEGFGMPPLEAALCGCKVVGFDGGGGEEFFNAPIFTKVDFYDHMGFIKEAEGYVVSNYYDAYEEQRLRLKEHYSMDNARQSFYNTLDNILGGRNG